MKAHFVFRIRVLTVFMVLIASVLMARLYFVQIIQGDIFSERADRQYVRPNQNLYDRGSIFFEDKEGRLVSGATLKSGFTVAINPKVLKDPKDTYEKLNTILPVDKETFFLRSGKIDDPYEEISKKVASSTAMKIAELDIDGLNIYKERWRYYPGDTLSAHTLGFVGFSGDTLAGRYGLERYYEDVLNREDTSLYVNFFAEIFANLNRSIFTNRGAQRAGDIVTTLEPSVQLLLEDQLSKINEKWNSRQSAGVIINPVTGAIYSLAVYPTFNTNSFETEANNEIFINPIVENVYEMGSIMKPLTIAAGLDSGAITANTTYYDYGTLELNGYTISNFDGKGRGRVSIQEVLSQSLNTGVAFTVREMGNEVFREYMLQFGIGEETGIDLPNEGAGLVSNLDSPRDLEYATASFGQGIATTPIGTVRALSSLGNGGTLITPHIAKQIKYKSGLSKNISWSEGDRVISEETSEEITRILVHVVDNALLGGTVKKPSYSIAAKTGTAQIAKVDGRGYYEDRFLHSFFGYFPAYDPQFLIFLFTIEPKEVRYASQTLTHPFMDITSFLINYYEIPPDR